MSKKKRVVIKVGNVYFSDMNGGPSGVDYTFCDDLRNARRFIEDIPGECVDYYEDEDGDNLYDILTDIKGTFGLGGPTVRAVKLKGKKKK